MTGDTVECFNCGHANPSWAQVCRSCGAPIRPDGPAGIGPGGIIPTDQASLISMGGTVGAIVLAIVLGLFLSGLIPDAPNVATETPSPTPSASASASPSVEPSSVESAAPSGSAVPLIGTVTFGTGIDPDTRAVTGATSSFSAGVAFAHSIQLIEPFAVNVIQEEVIRVADDGGLTVVQPREGSDLTVQADLMVAGFRVADAAGLIDAWGTGNFILRVYRGVELLAEGRFSFS
ncbi:MAG: zinc ribbon domain-containing protein [Chloroflexota bacterium]